MFDKICLILSIIAGIARMAKAMLLHSFLVLILSLGFLADRMLFSAELSTLLLAWHQCGAFHFYSAVSTKQTTK